MARESDNCPKAGFGWIGPDRRDSKPMGERIGVLGENKKLEGWFEREERLFESER